MIDLAKEWKELDRTRRHADELDVWNKRAASMTFKPGPSEYDTLFVRKLGLAEPARILDVGCGTGSIPVELAKRGHQVIAIDYSDVMLERARDYCKFQGVKIFDDIAFENGSEPGVFFANVSWQDDWDKYNITKNSVDYCIASRSLITPDLKDSLEKMSAVARRKAFATVVTGSSPRADKRVAEAMGVHLVVTPDSLYTFGILVDLGYQPIVDYINSPRVINYESKDEAFEKLIKTLDFADPNYEIPARVVCEERLRAWLNSHLVSCLDEEGKWSYRLDVPRMIPWAFLAWESFY